MENELKIELHEDVCNEVLHFDDSCYIVEEISEQYEILKFLMTNKADSDLIILTLLRIASICFDELSDGDFVKRKKILNDTHDLYIRKNHDYGDSFAEMRNEFPESILIRIYDKYSRYKTLLASSKQMVQDEKINDTLADLANYCMMEVTEIRMEKIPE